MNRVKFEIKDQEFSIGDDETDEILRMEKFEILSLNFLRDQGYCIVWDKEVLGSEDRGFICAQFTMLVNRLLQEISEWDLESREKFFAEE